MNPTSLVFTLLVVFQSGLVLTGGLVRLTKSGLGCPTWPECTPGSYKPTANQVEGQLHAWIEFGNRLLTFFLIASIIAAIILALRWGRSRSDKKIVYALALIQFLGIIAQILLGGITVLTHLNPFAVALHFLLSIVLISATLSLRQRMLNKPRAASSVFTPLIGKVLLLIGAVVVILGTGVTGTGPYAGDSQAKRFRIDWILIAKAHALSVFLLIALVLFLIVKIRRYENQDLDRIIPPKLYILLVAILAQGVVGAIQYFNGLPQLVVAFHLLGSALVWLALWNLIYTGQIFTSKRVSVK